MKHLRGFIDGEYQDGEARGRIFIGGQSGFGKTTEALRLLGQCQGGTIFYDHTGRNSSKGAVYIHTLESLEAFLRRNFSKRFGVIYQPKSGDLMTHFRGVCLLVAIFAGLVFMADEVDAYCDPTFGRSRMPPELYNLIHFGRHQGKIPGRRGVAFMCSARIPTSLSRDITSQSSQFRMFHEDDPKYVTYYRDATRLEVASLLPTLPKYRFVVFDKDTRNYRLEGGARRL